MTSTASPVEVKTAALRARVEALEQENRTLREAAGRGQAQEARRAAWLRRVGDAMPVLISYTDAGQRFRYCNAAYAVRFGRPLDQIVGRTLLEVMGPEVYEARRPFVERALAGQRVRYEVDFPGPSGVLHTVVEHIPDLAETGQVVGFYSLVQDVTERALTEAALSESEARFRRIADSAPAPIWVTRLDRKREFANRAYVAFLGVDYEAALAFDWRTVIHPEDAPRIYAEQVEKEASLQPFTLEARYRRADGAWRWLRSESQPRWGADGAHAGFIGVAYDITEAKQVQAELQRLNEELEARVAARTAELEQLYRKAPVPLLSQDANGVLISVSDRWLEFMGYDSRDQVLGRRALEFLTPECAERHVRELWPRLMAQGYADDVEYQIVKRSGEVAEVLISSRLGRDAEGNFARTMAAVVDVTARRRAEGQLREAQKMEAIGQLTGGVAHDFNNLLTPVIGSLDLLRRRVADDARATRLVDAALQGADRAAMLVQRLLAFARRQELRPQPTDVPRLVEGIRDLIGRSIGPQIRVEVEAAPALPPAMVDANQLELALLNLAVNARDAMPGGGTLRIEITAADAPASGELASGRYLRLAVVDDGPGMDEATLQRAVEPFFSTKPIGKGTGLGLSMVHGLAAQSGGRLDLWSRPGEGVRAELWLPVATSPATVGTPERPSSHPAQTLAEGATVLLVDDEALVQAVAADMLQSLGCRVMEADSGPEALRLLAERPEIDALVTDHLMPGMRGAELAKAAAALRPGLPILLITGYAEGLDGLDPGLRRLNKPFRPADLAEWLESWRRRSDDSEGASGQ